MNQQVSGKSYGATPAENYQRFFVPSIGGPVADDLISIAGLQPGQRVLDVACGTGVVTRLAAERADAAGAVAGLDLNPGMLAVARSQTPPDTSIEWHEASAEAMPLPDEVFDVVLCQMGLQFVPRKLAALREMRRVLNPSGRALVTVPGPKPPMFAVMTDALARHLSPEAASFGDLVFSMHDVDELSESAPASRKSILMRSSSPSGSRRQETSCGNTSIARRSRKWRLGRPRPSATR